MKLTKIFEPITINKSLLEKYNAKENAAVGDIIELHAEFEYIHPFQDGNGRVGRLVALFKVNLRILY